MEKIKMNKSKNLSVEEAFELFIRKCKVKNLAEPSIKSYQNKVQPFVDFCNGYKIADVTIDEVDNFTVHLKTEHNVKDISVVSYLRSVRAFLYYCMECNYMTSFKIHLPKAQKDIKETYSNEELERLLNKPDINSCTFTEYKVFGNDYVAIAKHYMEYGINEGRIEGSKMIIAARETAKKGTNIIVKDENKERIETVTYKSGLKTEDYYPAFAGMLIDTPPLTSNGPFYGFDLSVNEDGNYVLDCKMTGTGQVLEVGVYVYDPNGNDLTQSQ